MKQLYWLFNVIKPSNVRELINIIFLGISISFVIISFLSLQPGVLADVIRTIGASGTATTIIQLTNQFTKRIEQAIERNKFSTLFSCDDGSKEAISFLLPAFEIQALKEQENQEEDLDWKKYALENLSMKPTKGAIANDVKAVSYMISAYSKIFPRNDSHFLPRIRWDEDFKAKEFFSQDTNINKNTKTKELFFLIGFSNSIFVKINNRSIKTRYFFIENNKNLEKSKIEIENYIYTAYFSDETELQPQSNWYRETVLTTLGTGTTNGKYDYGILAKIDLGSKIILICAGISEVGTVQLAKYISSKWELIYQNLKNQKNNRTLKSNEPFVVLFRIPVNSENDEDVTISRTCINRWK